LEVKAATALCRPDSTTPGRGRRPLQTLRPRQASLNFHSSTYEWRVVVGARAQFKGSGTTNGAGDYGFMLTAIGGQVNGGGGPSPHSALAPSA